MDVYVSCTLRPTYNQIFKSSALLQVPWNFDTSVSEVLTHLALSVWKLRCLNMRLGTLNDRRLLGNEK